MPPIRIAPLFRVGLLLCAGATGFATLQTASQIPHPELEEATLSDLQERMTSGRETARSLAEKYLARIGAVDRQGPSLRSILEINPAHPAVKRLRALADSDDDKFRRWTGLLHDQALLAEGVLPEDPGAFARQIAALMAEE